MSMRQLAHAFSFLHICAKNPTKKMPESAKQIVSLRT